MPLTWDLTKAVDLPSLQTDEEWPITQTLIFATVGTGIGDLSEANAPEFYGRVHLMEAIYGPFVWTMVEGKRTERPITPEDVRRRIGLRTNVGKLETRASFLKRHCTSVVTDAMWQYQRAEEKRKAATAGEDYPTPSGSGLDFRPAV